MLITSIQKKYRDKLMSVNKLIKEVKSGDWIGVGITACVNTFLMLYTNE